MYLGMVKNHGFSADVENIVASNPNEGLGAVKEKPARKKRESLLKRAKELVRDSLTSTKVEYVEVPVETIVEKVVEVPVPATDTTETSESVFFGDYIPPEWSEQSAEDHAHALK